MARGLVGDTMAAPFARRLGLKDDGTYRRWEAETQRVPAWALIAAAEVAEVSIDDLLRSRADRAVLERLAESEQRFERLERRLDRQAELTEALLERLPEPAPGN